MKFPFEIQPQSFIETINPNGKVDIGQSNISFQGAHKEPFFFSNLSGGKRVDASWELINLKSKISLSEATNFQTQNINLWGWEHVVSPEMFFEINIQPGETVQWSRRYIAEKINSIRL